MYSFISSIIPFLYFIYSFPFSYYGSVVFGLRDTFISVRIVFWFSVHLFFFPSFELDDIYARHPCKPSANVGILSCVCLGVVHRDKRWSRSSYELQHFSLVPSQVLNKDVWKVYTPTSIS